jgi:2-deoxy-D-gluconate 3-dehydrogenase
MAESLAKAGAQIALVSHHGAPEAADSMRRYGVEAESFTFDLAELEQIPQLVDRVIERFGRIDILINNAGMQRRHKSEEFPKSDWDRVIAVNMTAVFFLCQAVGKHMLERHSGKIINIASLLSFQGGITVPAYAASKGAVLQFTKTLSNEWSKEGINVNCIAPGYMDTEMNEALIADPVRSRQILERIPAGRWGKGEDMAGAAVYLASKASDYVNGSVLVVDGGWMGR